MAVLKLLRNESLYESREQALSNIQSKLGTIGDGEVCIASYGTSWATAKSLLGITRVNGNTTSYTIFDLDAIDGDIDTKISTALGALDASSVANDNYVVLDVTQTDGQITATAGNITGVKLAGYAEGTDADVAATDTLGQALGKLQAQINAMDLTQVGGTSGDVITTVSEADGKVSASKSSLSDVLLTGYSKTSDTGAIAATDSVEKALSKIENTIGQNTVSSADETVVIDTTGSTTDLSVNIDGKTIVKAASGANKGELKADLTVTKLTSTEVTALADNNVKEAYKVIYSTDTNRTAIGDVIKVYKDQTLKSASFSNQILTLTYILADGTESPVEIDMSSIILETEVENGIQAIDHKLSIKLDTSGDDTGSGKFLTVGANGLKLDGVTDAITNAIDALDLTTDTAVAGQYISAIQQTDGVVGVKSRANVSDAVLTGYAKGTNSTAVADTDSVKGAIAKLENQVDKAKAAATTVVAEGTDAGNNMTIAETTDATDGHKTFTISLADVASATALSNEITARKAVDGQSGQTYAANSSANYIASATSLNDADVKLDTALKNADDAMLTGITGSDAITVSTKSSKNQTVSLKLDTTTGSNDNILTITSGQGLYLSSTWDCGTY